jgi:hypothetical protein
MEGLDTTDTTDSLDTTDTTDTKDTKDTKDFETAEQEIAKDAVKQKIKTGGRSKRRSIKKKKEQGAPHNGRSLSPTRRSVSPKRSVNQLPLSIPRLASPGRSAVVSRVSQ